MVLWSEKSNMHIIHVNVINILKYCVTQVCSAQYQNRLRIKMPHPSPHYRERERERHTHTHTHTHTQLHILLWCKNFMLSNSLILELKTNICQHYVLHYVTRQTQFSNHLKTSLDNQRTTSREMYAVSYKSLSWKYTLHTNMKKEKKKKKKVYISV